MNKLLERVTALEDQMKSRELPLGKIYDALHQIEECTRPLGPDETVEQWEAAFIETNGTREDFINKEE